VVQDLKKRFALIWVISPSKGGEVISDQYLNLCPAITIVRGPVAKGKGAERLCTKK